MRLTYLKSLFEIKKLKFKILAIMCYFCQKNVDDVDFKNTEMLSRYVSGFYKIKPRKKTNLCMHHQKKIATAIKRARQMGLMPYTPK